MDNLSWLPNIGTEIEQKLKQAGILTAAELREIGSKEAFMRIRKHDPDACLSMLNALEGAIQGVRWHNLPEPEKAELKKFFKNLKKED